MIRISSRLAVPLAVVLVAWPSEAAPQALTAEAASRSLEELQWRQCELIRDIREALSFSAPASDDEITALRERKDRLHEDIVRLEAELDGAARTTTASPVLAQAADRIRASQLEEAVLYSRGTLDQWDFGSIERLEQLILDRLQAVRDELGQPGNPVTCPELG